MKSAKWLSAAVLCVLACTPGGPIRVQSYWGTTIYRFHRHATYAWSATSPVGNPDRDTEAVHQLIRACIECALQEMHYIRAEEGVTPDFYISYRVGSGYQPTSSGPTNVALLAIEAHGADGRLIWGGWANGSVNSTLTPEVRRARVEHSVWAILGQFAPDPECHCSHCAHPPHGSH